MRRIVTCADCGQDREYHALGMCRPCYGAGLIAAGKLPHGYNRYTYGCRCGICKAAKADYMSARRGAAFLNTAPSPVPGITHGRAGYEEQGCRCEVCVEGKRANWRRSHPARGQELAS